MLGTMAGLSLVVAAFLGGAYMGGRVVSGEGDLLTLLKSVSAALGGMAGGIVEQGPTAMMFDAPSDPRTMDYVNGRFG